MQTYVIHRPNAWSSLEELQLKAEVSARIGNEEMADAVRWLRSYVTQHQGGRVGTVCIYQATHPDALLEHARRVGMPAEGITRVLDTVIVRPDPGS